MANFNSGDVVILKSGGPSMTVSDVEGDEVICDWFDGKKRMRDSFQASTLQIYNRPGPVAFQV
jgi:uncharacterized protein YodC (DUF2158 family)